MARVEDQIYEMVVLVALVGIVAFAIWVYMTGSNVNFLQWMQKMMKGAETFVQDAIRSVENGTAALRTQSPNGYLGGLPGVGTVGKPSNIATVITGTNWGNNG